MASSTADTVQSVLYGAIVFLSTGAGGAAAETCDIQSALGLNNCTAREFVFLVACFLAFVFAVPLFVAYVVDITPIKKIEIFLVSPSVLFCLVATAVGTSPKTATDILPVLLSWFSLLSSLPALLIAIKKPDSPQFELSLKTSEQQHPVAAPLTAAYDSQGTSTQPGYTTTQPGYTTATAAPYQAPQYQAQV